MVLKKRAKLHNSQNVKKEDAFASFFVCLKNARCVKITHAGGSKI